MAEIENGPSAQTSSRCAGAITDCIHVNLLAEENRQLSIKDRIVEALQGCPEGLDDDQLTRQLGLKHREQANQRCRELQAAGLVARRTINGKLRNVWLGSQVLFTKKASVATTTTLEKPWCWEGNVVGTVVAYLVSRQWQIKSVPDTATHAAGVDIHAERSGQSLLIEVKGYPSKLYEKGPKAGQPKRTNPSTQARHWTGEAVLSALLRLQGDKETQVAIAFPAFGVYLKLLARIRQSLEILGVMVLIVSETGTVEVMVRGRNIQVP